MTDAQIQQCKDKLLQLQKKHIALEQAFANTDDSVMRGQSGIGSRLSQSDAMEDQHMKLEASRDREMQAEKIEGGLRRIEFEQFGTCFYCEEEIPFARLEDDPTNTRCIKCTD